MMIVMMKITRRNARLMWGYKKGGNMGYLKCLLVYFIMCLITAIPNEVIAYLFTKDKILFITCLKVIVNMALGGYIVYYLINIYI